MKENPEYCYWGGTVGNVKEAASPSGCTYWKKTLALERTPYLAMVNGWMFGPLSCSINRYPFLRH